MCPKRLKTTENCPAEDFINIFSGPWTIIILMRLANLGPIRFGALKREISGISSRMLTERLRMLEENGFVIRDYKSTIPPEVYYSLSDRGCEMRKLLAEFENLAEKWQLNSM